MPTDTDLLIQALGQTVAELEHDLVVQREMLRAALDQLNGAQARQASSTDQLAALREDCRRYTASRV